MRMSRLERCVRAARSVMAAVALMAGATACLSTTSRIERGEAVATGNASYDEFFRQVNDTRAQAEAAKKEVAEARAPLAKALQLSASNATIEEIAAQTAERSKKLRQRGVLLHLDIAPDPKVAPLSGKGLDPLGDDLVKATQDSAQRSLAAARRLDDLAARAARLQRTRAELLEGVHAALGSQANDVARELEAAEGVLSSAASLSLKQAGTAARFLIVIADAIERDPANATSKSASSAAPSAKSANKPQGKWTGRAAPSGGAKTPAAAPAAPATPAPKPPPKGDDFEP